VCDRYLSEHVTNREGIAQTFRDQFNKKLGANIMLGQEEPEQEQSAASNYADFASEMAEGVDDSSMMLSASDADFAADSDGEESKTIRHDKAEVAQK